MSDNTTDINALFAAAATASANTSASSNINTPANANPQGPPGNATPGINLDNATINQIVSGIQKAGKSGATQLQSRDIPMNPSTITNDPYIQPHYVPQPERHTDYLEDHSHTQDMISKYNSNSKNIHFTDDIYNELKLPFLLAALFFLFQLDFLRTKLYKHLPFLFNDDGNIHFNGRMFNSALFGFVFFALRRLIDVFSTF
tara:strand:- start:2925 stop:3527 length:603 start_codon:yes stop_codon:yes gene_type:complete